MKRTVLIGAIFCLLMGIKTVSAQVDHQILPDPVGYVDDFASMLNLQDKETINKLVTELESKTTAQVAVVTVDSTKPDTIEHYAHKLFQKWGIGQKGKNNGVLFLIARKDRTLRIEVGYGLERILTNELCSNIINQMVVPQFKQGNFSQGIMVGTEAITRQVQNHTSD